MYNYKFFLMGLDCVEALAAPLTYLEFGRRNTSQLDRIEIFPVPPGLLTQKSFCCDYPITAWTISSSTTC